MTHDVCLGTEAHVLLTTTDREAAERIAEAITAEASALKVQEDVEEIRRRLKHIEDEISGSGRGRRGGPEDH